LDNLDQPDFVLFDLDPGRATFAQAVEVVHLLHDELVSEYREAVVKTSGKTGLHVLVRWKIGDFDEARAWSLATASHVAGKLPKLATVEIRKAQRQNRVYIDVMQNARGHHAVPPYVLRAVPGAPVSRPLQWSELKAKLDPKQFNIQSVPERIRRQKRDPMDLFREFR